MPEPYRTGLQRFQDVAGWHVSDAGELVSPETDAAFPFTHAIASWNAETPAGSTLETELRARVGDRWTRWFALGVWASDDDRHSVAGQRDADGAVEVDTLVLGEQATAYQLRLRRGGAAEPTVRSVAVTTSTAPVRPPGLVTGDPSAWGRALDVPPCSQMVYPDGGNVWCSPTSVAMVLGFHGFMPGACEWRVRHAVAGVHDPAYGHGNWPFNTAYAAEHGFEAVVARFESLAALEPWLAAGVPLVVSYAWRDGELDGAPVAGSDGHLGVLVGFDAAGDPIVNDPAAATDDEVRRTYDRAQLESLWLEHSGGATYLIWPDGLRGVPAIGRG